MTPDDPDLIPNGVDSTEAVEQAPVSIRDVASEVWDDLEEGASAEESSGQEGRKRDQYGRFVSQGEADPRVPAPDGIKPEPSSPTQPRQGEAVEAPQHWSAEDRATFAGNDPNALRALVVRRHSEMEADYTRKTQASAAAVDFVRELVPTFEDPVVKRSIAEAGMTYTQFVNELVGFHKRAMTDPQGLLRDLVQRLNVDPATVMPSPPPAGLTPQHLADPAVRYMADQVGTLSKKLARFENLEQQFFDFKKANASRDIDSFADERDASGNLLRPDFNHYIDAITEIWQVHPHKTIAQAYDDARWGNLQTRAWLIEQERTAEREKLAKEQALAKAQAASRGNLRGRTSPVSPPDKRQDGPRSLRETIESSAEEIGF